MAKYSVEDKTFSDIADAIRTKTGGTADITPLAMPAAILGITGGGSGNGFNLDNCDVTLLSQVARVNGGTKYHYWTEWGDYISSLDDIQVLVHFRDGDSYIYIKGLCRKEDNKLYIYRNQFLAGYSSNTLYENTGNSYITFDTTNGMEGYVDGSYQTPASKGSIFLITTKGAV